MTSQIVWISFECKTKSYGPCFQLSTSMFRWSRKVVKIRLTDFSIVLTENYKMWTRNCVSMFQGPNVVIWTWFSTFVVPVVPGLKTVIKIRPKHFLVVLIWSDKNCTSKSVSMFRPLNRVIWDRFSTLPATVDRGPENVVKIRAKHFSVVPMGKDKNCIPNS